MILPPMVFNDSQASGGIVLSCKSSTWQEQAEHLSEQEYNQKMGICSEGSQARDNTNSLPYTQAFQPEILTMANFLENFK